MPPTQVCALIQDAHFLSISATLIIPISVAPWAGLGSLLTYLVTVQSPGVHVVHVPFFLVTEVAYWLLLR